MGDAGRRGASTALDQLWGGGLSLLKVENPLLRVMVGDIVYTLSEQPRACPTIFFNEYQ